VKEDGTFEHKLFDKYKYKYKYIRKFLVNVRNFNCRGKQRENACY